MSGDSASHGRPLLYNANALPDVVPLIIVAQCRSARFLSRRDRAICASDYVLILAVRSRQSLQHLVRPARCFGVMDKLTNLEFVLGHREPSFTAPLSCGTKSAGKNRNARLVSDHCKQGMAFRARRSGMRSDGRSRADRGEPHRPSAYLRSSRTSLAHRDRSHTGATRPLMHQEENSCFGQGRPVLRSCSERKR